MCVNYDRGHHKNISEIPQPVTEHIDTVSLFDLGCKEGDKISFGYESASGKWTQDDDDIFIVSEKPLLGTRYTYMATMRIQAIGEDVNAQFEGLLPYTNSLAPEENPFGTGEAESQQIAERKTQEATASPTAGSTLKIRITKPLLLEVL
ncbi:MAG: hypothetical protein LQ351_006581 [Letrouitia transgressa]|nr:MAG: hypothetical protein LQ351_006581 [Letrouitia transgressa]